MIADERERIKLRVLSLLTRWVFLGACILGSDLTMYSILALVLYCVVVKYLGLGVEWQRLQDPEKKRNVSKHNIFCNKFYVSLVIELALVFI